MAEVPIMAKAFTMRTWATPLTLGSFILMAATGVLMFFDVVPGYVTFVHEWFSWLFLLGAGAHIAVNVRPLKFHLRSTWGRASVALFAAVLLASTISFGQITAPQLKWPLAEALLEAPLSVLAALTRVEPDELLQRLAAHGISATPDQSIDELASAHRMDEFHMLGLIVLHR
ncbi:DUF4405 domain-containing protein [Acuticoccus mangrovi]|uniref:DUF4405 domain-containing protein n=1 Tax=Acuticoccus mangrovi TaxID=2796142 RepID=A0A934MIE8_9HYPH|nr:DUF4405 domain-containing protein [Acuticoccus mangrovi]MBJ3777850.1 DUF4405 domain-containing protein [Acuticoccus mangrovi]